jgi:hypothetical protein
MTALHVIRSLGMVAVLTVAALGQSIIKAEASLSTGFANIDTSAPSGYTSVILKLIDKNGDVIGSIETTPGTPWKPEITPINAEVRVIATFKKASGAENIQGPKDVAWV